MVLERLKSELETLNISLWDYLVVIVPRDSSYAVNETQLFSSELAQLSTRKSKKAHDLFLQSRGLIKLVFATLYPKLCLESFENIEVTFDENIASLKVILSGIEVFNISLSHSRSYIAIILSVCERSENIGIDIEDFTKERDFSSLSEICLTNVERERILGSDEHRSGFYHIWTLKEALVKATGINLVELFKIEAEACVLDNGLRSEAVITGDYVCNFVRPKDSNVNVININ